MLVSWQVVSFAPRGMFAERICWDTYLPFGWAKSSLKAKKRGVWLEPFCSSAARKNHTPSRKNDKAMDDEMYSFVRHHTSGPTSQRLPLSSAFLLFQTVMIRFQKQGGPSLFSYNKSLETKPNVRFRKKSTVPREFFFPALIIAQLNRNQLQRKKRGENKASQDQPSSETDLAKKLACHALRDVSTNHEFRTV